MSLQQTSLDPELLSGYIYLYTNSQDMDGENGAGDATFDL